MMDVKLIKDVKLSLLHFVEKEVKNLLLSSLDDELKCFEQEVDAQGMERLDCTLISICNSRCDESGNCYVDVVYMSKVCNHRRNKKFKLIRRRVLAKQCLLIDYQGGSEVIKVAGRCLKEYVTNEAFIGTTTFYISTRCFLDGSVHIQLYREEVSQ